MSEQDREQRVLAYQETSRKADEMAERGRKEDALAVLEAGRAEAERAGDSDYVAFFEAETLFYSDADCPRAIERLKAGLEEVQRRGLRADAFLLRNMGVYHGHSGDPDAAIQWYDKALAEDPRDGDAMRQKGVSLAKKGDLDAAIQWLDKVLAENPRDWKAMRSKGVSLSKKGDLDAAIQWFEKALAENPRDWDAMRQKGVSLSKRGDEDSAIQWFDKALAENPRDGDAMCQKGVALSTRGDEDAAIEWFDKALAENPRDWDAMREKGVALSKKGDLDTGIQWFDKALAENPRDWDAMRNKGVALSKKGDLDAAIEWFDKALAENPRDWDAMREKGMSLAKKGDLDAAIQWFDKALAENPTDSLAHHQAAVAEYRRGNLARARERMGKAVKLDPDRWREDFVALCNVCGIDPDKAWRELFASEAEKPPGPAPAVTTPIAPSATGKAATTDSPSSLETKSDHVTVEQSLKGMEWYIRWLRDALKEERETYDREMEKGKEIRTEFLLGESLLDEQRTMFFVLRRWNSYTPAIPSVRDQRSVGGGYFLWHQGCGTVIDPGLNFIENFALAGGRLCDIHNVVLTHAHNDHTADFESLRTLFYQRNRDVEKRNGDGNANTKLTPSRIRFFLAGTAFQKFAGMLPLARRGFTQGVFALNPGTEFSLTGEAGGGKMRVLPAYHDDILSRDHAVGLLFTLDTSAGERRLLLTSDTGLYPLEPEAPGPHPMTQGKNPQIYHRYLEAGGQAPDVMVLHIGSVKKEELDPAKDTDPSSVCYANHLGIIGVTRTIVACMPRLAVVSEFGEEMREIRVKLMQHIQDRVIDVMLKDKPADQRPRIVPGDPGFIYDLGTAEFVDWSDAKWKPIEKLGFLQPSDDNPSGAIGYFEAADDGAATLRAGNAVRNFATCLRKRAGHLRGRPGA